MARAALDDFFPGVPFGSEHANSACWSTPGAWACPRARACASSYHALQLPYPWSEHKCGMRRRIRAKTDSEAAVEVSSDDDMISISSISETDSDGFHRHISLIKPTDDGDGGGLGEHKPTDYGDGGGLGEHTGEGICGGGPGDRSGESGAASDGGGARGDYGSAGGTYDQEGHSDGVGGDHGGGDQGGSEVLPLYLPLLETASSAEADGTTPWSLSTGPGEGSEMDDDTLNAWNRGEWM